MLKTSTFEEETPAASAVPVQAAERNLQSSEEVIAEHHLSETAECDNSLVVMMQHEMKARKRQTAAVIAASGALLLCIKSLTLHMASAGTEEFGRDLAICFTLLFGIGGVMTWSMMMRSYRGKKRLADQIAKYATKAHIGTLIRALKVDSKEIKNLAKDRLIELLPSFNASDANMIAEGERGILRATLVLSPYDKGMRDLTELWSPAADRREMALRLAILKAYEQIGGAKELPVVSKLADSNPKSASLNRMPEEIKGAAVECLPYLQARAAGETAGKELLRASSADTLADQALLRAVETRLDTASESLLRATDLR